MLPSALASSEGALSDDREHVGLTAFAEELGVALSYLARIVRETNEVLAAQTTVRAAGLP